MTSIRLLPALLALALLAPLAAADPVAVNPTGTAYAELVAVSATGPATCTSETCVAVSGTGSANAGRRCSGFVCAPVAVSGTGSARAFTYCDRFGQACFSIVVGTAPSVYACYGDVSNVGTCRGVL